ncbi:MAG: YIP1 family protein [Caldilineales bacterium]|nr:YIP1 family protein [Caldilineales bacterium]
MLVQRMLGVLKLKTATYEDILRDDGATIQAALIVLIAGLFTSLGVASLLSDFGTGVAGHVVANIVGWLLITVVLFVVGVILFKGKATFMQLLRIVGFSFTPHLLGILAYAVTFIPIIRAFSVAFYLAALGWSALVLFFAVRISLRFEAGRALGVLIISVFPYLIGLGIVLQLAK